MRIAAGMQNGAIGQRHFQGEHRVPGDPVLDAAHATRISGEIAADRANLETARDPGRRTCPRPASTGRDGHWAPASAIAYCRATGQPGALTERNRQNRSLVCPGQQGSVSHHHDGRKGACRYRIHCRAPACIIHSAIYRPGAGMGVSLSLRPPTSAIRRRCPVPGRHVRIGPASEWRLLGGSWVAGLR